MKIRHVAMIVENQWVEGYWVEVQWVEGYSMEDKWVEDY